MTTSQDPRDAVARVLAEMEPHEEWATATTGDDEYHTAMLLDADRLIAAFPALGWSPWVEYGRGDPRSFDFVEGVRASEATHERIVYRSSWEPIASVQP